MSNSALKLIKWVQMVHGDDFQLRPNDVERYLPRITSSDPIFCIFCETSQCERLWHKTRLYMSFCRRFHLQRHTVSLVLP